MKLNSSKLTTVLALLFSTSVFAQKIIDPKKETERQGTNRANKKIEQGIDAGFDKLEEGIGNLFKKKKDSPKKENLPQTTSQQDPLNKSDAKVQQESTLEMNMQWSKYDFVPGDEVIFEDVPDIMEENGEFPSRWDLVRGQVEIANINGENVVMILDGGSAAIVPYLKNSKEDYLPEVFTIEMDVYFEPGNHGQRYWIKLRDDKNQWGKGVNEKLEIYVNGLDFLNTSKSYPGTEKYNWGNNPVGGWKHIAIAYTKGKFKAYMDDTRLINVPHLEGNPFGITITASGPKELNMFIKNIRISKGGVKYYDRVLSDGKIIVNGIRFDVNKASIKPESNGAINKIFELMQKQPDLKFSVEGHTDSDGDEATNQTLSEARAKAVMDRLISMGISSNRLKSSGWGESSPIGENSTPEGKANNRRVEFVKF